jgi:predicted GH43/DUF377 family glycosyl hydrolase
MHDLFFRHTNNPLITAKDLPYHTNAVFNAGAADLGNEILLLVRVETPSGRSHLIVARSEDGIGDWRFEKRALLHPAQGFDYEINGVEDCRLTWLAERNCWVIAYTAYSDFGPGVALATTRDFKTVERIGLVSPPDDKNAALFPRSFNGLFAMLHRPSVGGGSVWLSYSPDLIYWGKPEVVIPVRGGPWWDGARVGAGLQPIETEAGWLVIYHGVKLVVGDPIYRLGATLLELDEPHRLIGRTRRWLLSPSVYYGAADSSICLAKAKLADVLHMVTKVCE